MLKNVFFSSFFVILSSLLFVISDSIINYLSPLGIKFYHHVFYGLPGYIIVPIFLYFKGTFKMEMYSSNYFIPILRSIIFLPLPFFGFVALKNIDLPEFTSLVLSIPLFSILISIFFLKEKINFIIIFSLIFGFIGVLLVIQPGFENFNYYYLLVLVIAFFLSINNALVNKYNNICSSLAYFVYGGMLVHILSSIFFIFDPIKVNLFILFLILIGSIAANSAIAFMIIGYKRSKKHFGAISCLIYTQIFWSLLIGLFIFDEQMNIFALIGVSLIIISGILSIPGQYKQLNS